MIQTSKKMLETLYVDLSMAFSEEKIVVVRVETTEMEEELLVTEVEMVELEENLAGPKEPLEMEASSSEDK
ncbi:hypothetical protein ACOSQ2_008586 [Xanthoceras sorbifolium]